jgi:hypothetical protein
MVLELVYNPINQLFYVNLEATLSNSKSYRFEGNVSGSELVKRFTSVVFCFADQFTEKQKKTLAFELISTTSLGCRIAGMILDPTLLVSGFVDNEPVVRAFSKILYDQLEMEKANGMV